MSSVFIFQYNIKKKEEIAPAIPPPCEGRLTADKKGPIPLPDEDDSNYFHHDRLSLIMLNDTE